MGWVIALLAPEPFTLTNTASQLPPIDNETKVRIEGYFGQGTLDISDQLFLKAGLRYDGASTFAQDKLPQLVSQRERRLGIHQANRRPGGQAHLRQAAGGLWGGGHSAQPVPDRVQLPERRHFPGRVGRRS